MKLDDYMKAERITDQGFGDLIGAKRLTVLKYRHGKIMPSPKKMGRIIEETHGMVTPSDFYTSTDHPK